VPRPSAPVIVPNDVAARPGHPSRPCVLTRIIPVVPKIQMNVAFYLKESIQCRIN